MFRSLSAFLCSIVLYPFSWGSLIWEEDFDIGVPPDALWGGIEFESGNPHFKRSDYPRINGDAGIREYEGYSGDFFLSARGSLGGYRIIQSEKIFTESYENLKFQGLFSAGQADMYEPDDWAFLAVSYDDGANWEKILQFNSMDDVGMGLNEGFSPLEGPLSLFEDASNHSGPTAELGSSVLELSNSFSSWEISLEDSKSLRFLYGVQLSSQDEYFATDWWRIEGHPKPISQPLNSVPEPSTYGVIGGAFICLLILRRWRMNRKKLGGNL